MTIFQGEIVALIVAIVTAVGYLVKISLQIQDYFNKIERAVLGVKEELKDSYALLTQEQFSLRQENFKLNKRVNYLTKIIAEIKPDAFKRSSDFDD
jgi:predicted Holliday junction resolvase-like endonuclease